MNNTVSDVNGNFNLSNLKAGNYNLVITMIGYKPVIKDTTIKDQDIKLSLQLEQQATNLNAVTVIPDKFLRIDVPLRGIAFFLTGRIE